MRVFGYYSIYVWGKFSYQKALGKASRKSGLTLPVDCPWTIEKILDEDSLPG
ncbi:DUF29 family protein [Microcystis ichthyoblabe FBCC-A1114]|uniref:DUF29 family protein n=1 Tax=Microcystis TaxID=1125 RepID=UPI00339026F0